jgi:hypothetical protein
MKIYIKIISITLFGKKTFYLIRYIYQKPMYIVYGRWRYWTLVIWVCQIEQLDVNEFLITIKVANERNVESTKPVDYIKIYIKIFSITLLRKKHHFLDPIYQKPYIQPVTHYYIGIRRSVLIFAFLTNNDDGLEIFTIEVYVEVSIVENWLFRPLSCMLKEYSVNYLKNFKFKLHIM